MNLCEKEFDKKMFVNLDFALALNYKNYTRLQQAQLTDGSREPCCHKLDNKNAERLLKYNGYTLNSIEKQFDEVCSKAFAIGFSREIVIDLL